MLYLALITAGLLGMYVLIVRYSHVFFFEGQGVRGLERWSSLLFIMCASVAGYVVVTYVPDYEIGNRILHGYGGGFMVTLMALLALRDGGMTMSPMRRAVFVLMLVSTLGTVNELMEFFLTRTFEMEFITRAEDTWFDLLSNTVGAGLGLLILPYVFSQGVVSDRKL